MEGDRSVRALAAGPQPAGVPGDLSRLSRISFSALASGAGGEGEGEGEGEVAADGRERDVGWVAVWAVAEA